MAVVVDNKSGAGGENSEICGADTNPAWPAGFGRPGHQQRHVQFV